MHENIANDVVLVLYKLFMLQNDVIVTLTYGLPSSFRCTYICHFNCCSNVHMYMLIITSHHGLLLSLLWVISQWCYFGKKNLQMLPYLLGLIIKCVPLPHYPMTNLSWSCGGSEQDQLGSQQLNSSGSLWLTSSSTNELAGINMRYKPV